MISKLECKEYSYIPVAICQMHNLRILKIEGNRSCKRLIARQGSRAGFFLATWRISGVRGRLYQVNSLGGEASCK